MLEHGQIVAINDLYKLLKIKDFFTKIKLFAFP